MEKTVVVSIRNASKMDFGGGEKVPVYIAREIMRHAKNIDVIVCSNSNKLREFAQYESVKNMKTWWWPRQNWSGKKALLFPVYLGWQAILLIYYLVLFARLHPTVVHLQSKDDFIAGTVAAKIVGAHVFWSDYADLKHIWKNHAVWYKNPIGKLIYLVASLTEKIVVVSQEDKRLILENIPDSKVESKMEVIYYGAFDVLQGVKKNSIFTIISTNRLVVDKGVSELIAAFKLFHANHPSTQLHILGDGPDRELFIKQAKDVDAIQFLKHQKDPSSYVETAHIFTLPTYHEGFSIALVEACMLNIAIVATRVGGNVEIIRDHYNGLLVEVKSSQQLYEAFELLYSDPKLRETLANNARHEYEKLFNFKTIIIDKFAPLYKGSMK